MQGEEGYKSESHDDITPVILVAVLRTVFTFSDVSRHRLFNPTSRIQGIGQACSSS